MSAGLKRLIFRFLDCLLKWRGQTIRGSVDGSRKPLTAARLRSTPDQFAHAHVAALNQTTTIATAAQIHPGQAVNYSFTTATHVCAFHKQRPCQPTQLNLKSAFGEPPTNSGRIQ